MLSTVSTPVANVMIAAAPPCYCSPRRTRNAGRTSPRDDIDVHVHARLVQLQRALPHLAAHACPARALQSPFVRALASREPLACTDVRVVRGAGACACSGLNPALERDVRGVYLFHLLMLPILFIPMVTHQLPLALH